MNTMYARMLMLPIFTGLTETEFTEILTHIHIEFRQFNEGDTIVSQYEKCNNLIYLLEGNASCTLSSLDGKYEITENLQIPHVIEPHSMFGMQQNYTHSYICNSACQTLIVSKREFVSYMMNCQIVKFNVLNILCAHINRATTLLMEYEPDSVEKKIVRFIEHHIVAGKGSIELRVRMEDLGAIINETRLNVSNAIRNLRSAELLGNQQRGMIIVPDFQKLKTAVKNESFSQTIHN